jgi:hypothetical protein
MLLNDDLSEGLFLREGYRAVKNVCAVILENNIVDGRCGSFHHFSGNRINAAGIKGVAAQQSFQCQINANP